MNSPGPYIPNASTTLDAALEEIGLPKSQLGSQSALFELGPGITYLLDGNNLQIRYISEKAEPKLPSLVSEALRKVARITDLIHPEDKEAYIEKEHGAGREFIFEYRIRPNEKLNWIPIQDFRVAIADEQGTVIAYIGRLTLDETRQRSIDTLCHHTWGEVSKSSVRRYIHDFNNTIAGIYSLSELYAQEGASSDSMLEGMGHIRDNSLRAQKITQRIREVTMINLSGKVYCDLEKIIEEQKDLILTLLPKGTELELDLQAPAVQVHVDPNAFIQCLMHIIANCADAAPKIPVVRFQTYIVKSPNPHIRIEVFDNGSGIKSQNLSKTTDALFTTKDPSKHSGMGLFMARSFAIGCAGSLEVESNGENQTTVSLQIPLANLQETLATNAEGENNNHKETQSKSVSKKEAFTVLIYSWEDVAQSPLLALMRENGWKYRIHIDPHQVMLDTRDLKDSLDGIIVCHSGLDENAIPLLEQLTTSECSEKTAVITMDGLPETLPHSIQKKFGYEASYEVKPSTQYKRLVKFFS
ncbi:PAS domain-containing sensor histidine kinase [Puniceicoccaceae bacterium K14]|nr:PAS domain-containing sensor histidine kinase [Puniceicoccaceae bacterium K14]